MDYPSENPKKRSSTLKVMLHPKMHDDLRALAERLGQAPSTLASIALSQYVAQQTAALGASDRAVAGLFEQMTPMFREMFKNVPETEPEVLLGLTQQQLPLTPRKTPRKKASK